MTLTHIEGCYCPSCGQQRLHRMEKDGKLCCMNDDCSNPFAAQILLSDPEIHHIVRFRERGFFSIKHPLRERIGSELLDCPIHTIVVDAIEEERVEPMGTWRLIGVPPARDFEGEWEWEKL